MSGARRAIAAVVSVIALAVTTAASAQPVRDGDTLTWTFEARLNGSVIGEHRFIVSGPPQARTVDSRASFDVKLLGLTVYRYRHVAAERWRADCLSTLKSETDDDGSAQAVDWREPAATDGACLMSYAYWHPKLREQSRLLNPQTGEIEAVRFEPLPDATLTVRGRELPAARWRLRTPRDTLTLWLAREDGAWLGLDAQVKGGRLLTYRLR